MCTVTILLQPLADLCTIIHECVLHDVATAHITGIETCVIISYNNSYMYKFLYICELIHMKTNSHI